MDVLDLLEQERPMFHWGGTRRWDTAPETLCEIQSSVSSGMKTLETGCGASTVVFAATGAQHTVISPTREEQERVADFLESNGIGVANVEFVAGFSDDVLPVMCGNPDRMREWESWYAAHQERLGSLRDDELFHADARRTLDYVFLDGAHSFPYPIVDWHYSMRGLKVGGRMLIDDIPIQAVGALFGYLTTDPSWRLAGVFDDRAAAFGLVAEPRAEDWTLQPYNRRAFYGFKPPLQRGFYDVASEVRLQRRKLGDRWPELRRLKARLFGDSQ